tara:strand:- start:7368 stop:8660 length:1293 start_codon:yes stop_codon:yes gene_type:complete
MSAVSPIIEIPYLPRSQQQEVHDLVSSHRFGVVVAHRRWGKSVCFANELIKRALTTGRTDYRAAYLSPTYGMSKQVIWDELRRYCAALPPELYKFNDSELRVDFVNGSRVRLFGADNPDRLRGQYFDTVVADEMDMVKLETFTEVIRPAISDRKGSFYAIGTFKNSNGALGQLYDMAEQDGWFRRIYAADTSGALDEEELRDAAKVMSREEYAREYECVRVSAVKNSVLGRLVDEADDADRITSVPYDPALPVTTAWDLGIGDATSIWFMQQVGRGEVRLIDYYEASGEGLPHYAQVLKDKGYTYGEHIAPHDIGVRELGTGKTRVEVAAGFGISFRVLPRISQNTRSEIDERIEASRMLLPRCYFDKKKTAIGVEALRSWHRDTTPTGELKHHPVHDWSSHAADAFGYLAMGIRQVGSVERPRAKVKRY